MNVLDIDIAINEARGTAIPIGVDLKPSLTRCELAEAVQVFLRAIEPKAGFIGAIGVRAAHGAITRWKRANGC